MRVARPRTLRRGCASAQRTVRAVRSTHRGPSTGGVAPGRFRGVWLHRSPPRPSIHGLSVCIGALEVPTTGVRDTRKRVCATLLTLTPTLPSRPDPCGPTCRPDCLSWVCPKIAPPSSRTRESDARAPRLRGSLRGRAASSSRVPSAWFLTTSTVCSSPIVQVCCALLPILGFTVFHPVAKRAPHGVASALRSFPSVDSGGSERHLSVAAYPRARVTEAPIAGRPPSPRSLPPHPSPPDCARMVSHPTPAAVTRVGCRSRGLEALLHRRVRCLHVRCHT
jgi:hypothetical protein